MIANCITISRILFSVCLIIFSPFSGFFAVLYVLCGVTDVLDGFFARKMHTESKVGEWLDSIADLFFIVAYAVKILPLLNIPRWLWIWTSIIAAVKLAGILFASKKAHRLLIEHSFGNKFTGVLLFFLPMSIFIIDVIFGATLVCVAATGTVIVEIRKMKNNDF